MADPLGNRLCSCQVRQPGEALKIIEQLKTDFRFGELMKTMNLL
jgi:hypothetical protein